MLKSRVKPGKIGLSASDGIQHFWRRPCSWTSAIAKCHPSLTWEQKGTWTIKSSPLISQAPTPCDNISAKWTSCNILILIPQYGMGGESTWGAKGLLGKDGCPPCLRCIPAAPSSPPTPPGSEEVIWSRALEHSIVTSQPKPKEEKGLSCWVTPTAAICERGRCGEGACSCC